MRDLFSDPEGEAEEARRERDIRFDLTLIQEELELFSHPYWHLFVRRLDSFVKRDLEGLVNCPPDEVAPTRARIKAHRHLLGLEAELQGREAELRARLEAPEEEDDE